MNSKIAFTKCEDLKNSWSFPISQQVSGTSTKKLSIVFSNVHELLCKRKSDVNCNELFYEKWIQLTNKNLLILWKL